MTALVTAQRLKNLAPTADPKLVDAVVAGWPEMVAAGINTPPRVSAFIATICTETGGLRVLSENLNYTSVARIRAIWPSRFKTNAAAAPFVRNPEGLANKVYGGRLGNTQPGDGWRYRGGGFIQTTGRTNYKAAGHERDPEALRDPKTGFTAAVKFWSDAKVNALADKGDARAIRKRVNGGAIGLGEFTDYLSKARRIFVPFIGGAPAPAAAPPAGVSPTPPVPAAKPVQPATAPAVPPAAPSGPNWPVIAGIALVVGGGFAAFLYAVGVISF